MYTRLARVPSFMRVLATTNVWSPNPFVIWPLGTLFPNGNERKVDQVTEITAQN
jgi:hypothetical protein